jgi:predicted small metal-binding protein
VAARQLFQTFLTTKGPTMASQVTCECNYIARADTDDDVVAMIRAHLRTDHPQLLGTVTEDVIRTWVEIVP